LRKRASNDNQIGAHSQMSAAHTKEIALMRLLIGANLFVCFADD
jgi:hypothetical protein